MLEAVKSNEDPNLKRLISALTDIGNGENTDLAYLHACQAVTELVAAK